MSIDELRSLAKEFGTEAARCLGSRIYAVWLAGSVARGDFIENTSDLDLEMILKIGEEKKRTTYEMDELRDLSERFNLRAQMLGATRLDCFVHRLDDLKPKFHTLQLALFGEAVLGPPPREVVSTGCMEKNVDKLAMEFISEAARDACDGPRGRMLFNVKRGVKVIMETQYEPAIVWNAREVPKAANFVTGRGVWTKPEYFQVFGETFPEHRDLVNEIWEYLLDHSRLQARGESYVEDFLKRCLTLPIDIEERLSKSECDST